MHQLLMFLAGLFRATLNSGTGGRTLGASVVTVVDTAEEAPGPHWLTPVAVIAYAVLGCRPVMIADVAGDGRTRTQPALAQVLLPMARYVK